MTTTTPRADDAAPPLATLVCGPTAIQGIGNDYRAACHCGYRGPARKLIVSAGKDAGAHETAAPPPGPEKFLTYAKPASTLTGAKGTNPAWLKRNPPSRSRR